MSIENFIFDDDEFEKGAGISPVSQAYVKVFESIKNLAEEGIRTSQAGIDKSVLSITARMLTKVAALNDVSSTIKLRLGTTSVDPLGNSSEAIEDLSSVGEDDELVAKLDEISIMNSEISYEDALNQIEENKNIQDNGTDDFGEDPNYDF